MRALLQVAAHVRRDNFGKDSGDNAPGSLPLSRLWLLDDHELAVDVERALTPDGTLFRRPRHRAARHRPR